MWKPQEKKLPETNEVQHVIEKGSAAAPTPRGGHAKPAAGTPAEVPDGFRFLRAEDHS